LEGQFADLCSVGGETEGSEWDLVGQCVLAVKYVELNEIRDVGSLLGPASPVPEMG
jgi:hypothetical protein